MKQCFLSRLPLLDVPGETVMLDRAWLTAAQAEAVQGAQAWAYAKLAAASPQSQDWKQRQYRHAVEGLGLELVAVIDETFLLRHPVARTYATITSGGRMTSLPPLADIPAGERTPPWVQVPQRMVFRMEGIAPALAKEMQQALLQSKSVPLQGLLQGLGLHDALLHPEAAAASRLRLNHDLRAEWQADSFAADCDATLVLTEAILQGVRNAEAGVIPQYDLGALLDQANALAVGGDYLGLSAAQSLLFDQSIYFSGADLERLIRTRTRIQEDIFDYLDIGSDELDPLFADKTVDASQYSGDLDD